MARLQQAADAFAETAPEISPHLGYHNNRGSTDCCRQPYGSLDDSKNNNAITVNNINSNHSSKKIILATVNHHNHRHHHLHCQIVALTVALLTAAVTIIMTMHTILTMEA